MTEIRFPRQGKDYAPLPDGEVNGTVSWHTVQTINAEPGAIYALMTRPEVMHIWHEGIVSVTDNGDRTQHWKIEDPGTGTQAEFTVEILEAVPGERFVTRVSSGLLEGSTNAITLHPTSNGRGTVVTWVSHGKPPAGWLSTKLSAVVTRSPKQMTIENLRHLKALIESGEIPTVEGQPAGPRGVIGKWKQWMLGETLPTPPGTMDHERPEDLPRGPGLRREEALAAGIAIIAGVAAWYGVKRLKN